MKFTDRIPTKPNQKTIRNVNTGEIITAIVEYADEPTQEGTPLNALHLNQITKDIIAELNNSPASIVRDYNGTAIMDKEHDYRQYGEKWIYTENDGIMSIRPGKSATFEATLSVDMPTKCYFWYPAFVLSYDNITGIDSASSTHPKVTIEMRNETNESLGSKVFSISENGKNEFFDFYAKLTAAIDGVGKGKPITIKYSITITGGVDGSVKRITNLQLTASCMAEKKYIFNEV